jgi:hypothetical protein
MPNNAYLRSTRREREVVNALRAEGYTACRSAGSHSAFDVWAVNGIGDVKLIQIKTQKGGRFLVMDCKKSYQGTVNEYLYTYTGVKNARSKKGNRGRNVKVVHAVSSGC